MCHDYVYNINTLIEQSIIYIDAKVTTTFSMCADFQIFM